MNEATLRRIQIREAIKAHLEREKQLFSQGIKVLSLFFIDEVAKYRDYSQPDEKGDYARIFEEEYRQLVAESSALPTPEHSTWLKHLAGISPEMTHNGYFSIDKKGRMKDPDVGKKSSESDDVDAYDLILKDKERLLSFAEPVRFIFSHSALREGWDNPNVFVICALKKSDNTVSRRQEVGRGLRLAVNQQGDRMDLPATVHDINVLTVVASESYKDFVSTLQKEISDALSARPRQADEAYFIDKVLLTGTTETLVTPALAKQIYKYLLKNDYTDNNDQITPAYHEAKAQGTLAPLPPELAPHAEPIFRLIDGVFSEAMLPGIEDDRKARVNRLNPGNYEKQEFKELWSRISHKAVYRVDFDSDELIGHCVEALNRELRVAQLQYIVHVGAQREHLDADVLKSRDGFEVEATRIETSYASVQSAVKYDLIGQITEGTKLTRKTVATILGRLTPQVFGQFRQNPEHFIAEARRIINEQKACVIIEHLTYDTLNETHGADIFTAGQSKQDFSKATEKLRKHIYDHVIPDSNVEREFVKELDTCDDVVVYAKLPKGFFIPTPVGDYNPDWAISFKKGTVKHIYFVAETKGSMSSLELRGIEEKKISCARKFFDEVNRRINPDAVRYDVVNSFGKLMEVVARPAGHGGAAT